MIDTRKPAANQDDDRSPTTRAPTRRPRTGRGNLGRRAAARRGGSEPGSRLAQRGCGAQGPAARRWRTPRMCAAAPSARSGATLFAASNFARDLLSVADNMARALRRCRKAARKGRRGDAQPVGRHRPHLSRADAGVRALQYLLESIRWASGSIPYFPRRCSRFRIRHRPARWSRWCNRLPHRRAGVASGAGRRRQGRAAQRARPRRTRSC